MANGWEEISNAYTSRRESEKQAEQEKAEAAARVAREQADRLQAELETRIATLRKVQSFVRPLIAEAKTSTFSLVEVDEIATEHPKLRVELWIEGEKAKTAKRSALIFSAPGDKIVRVYNLEPYRVDNEVGPMGNPLHSSASEVDEHWTRQTLEQFVRVALGLS